MQGLGLGEAGAATRGSLRSEQGRWEVAGEGGRDSGKPPLLPWLCWLRLQGCR